MILQCFHLSYMELFQDVHFTLEENGLYLLYGKSGCGKTTFLHILAQLITTYQGEILLDHQSLTKKENASLLSNIGIMFQNECLIHEYRLFDHLKMTGSSIAEIEDILDKLDLKQQKNVKIADLSLGQKQRATLALIALKRPPIILLDEPTSQLDKMHLEVCKELILSLSKESIVIIASHQYDHYKKNIDGLLEIKDKTIQFTQFRHSYLFSKKRVQSKFTLKQSFLLFILHLKTRYLISIKLIGCFMMIFLFTTFLFEMNFSFEHFLVDYENRYPDLYTLYIDEIEEEKLMDLQYDYLTSQALSVDENEIHLISSQAKLKEGKMPKQKELIVSEDLGKIGDKIQFNDLTFQIVGILNNPLVKRSYYLNFDGYELLMKDQGKVMVFHDLDTLKRAQKQIEGTLLTRTNQDYLSFYDSYHSIITLFLTFLYCFSGYCLFNMIILLFLQLKSYLSYDLHEMVFLKCEGYKKRNIIVFYMVEIALNWVIALILSLIIFFKVISYFQVYFVRNFFSVDFLKLPDLMIDHNGMLILVFIFLFLISLLLIGINIQKVFSRSMSNFVKENEGC